MRYVQGARIDGEEKRPGLGSWTSAVKRRHTQPGRPGEAESGFWELSWERASGARQGEAHADVAWEGMVQGSYARVAGDQDNGGMLGRGKCSDGHVFTNMGSSALALV